MKDYKQLANSINTRLNPENLEGSFFESVATATDVEILQFVNSAMKAVDPVYTAKSKEAGEKVKEHLSRGLQNKVFRYQGSVMTDTHIRGYSDIDLLVISTKFYSYDSQRVNNILLNESRKQEFRESSVKKLITERDTSSYSGDSLSDLLKLRLDSETILSGVYDECDVTKPKAIKIENKNLNREVDVVIANWYDDVRSIINDKGVNRGIQVYDKSLHQKGRADYPFVSIERINVKSSNTEGRLKKMIRFLKNVKEYSGLEIDLSSFDINAICYDINENKYKHLTYYKLVGVIYDQMNSLCTDKSHSDELVSVDEREYIFRNDSTKLENLKVLMEEVNTILQDLKDLGYG